MNHRHSMRASALLVLVATVSLAQGPGTVSFGVIDTEAVTLGLQNLGVQYMASTSTIIVTGRGNTVAGPYSGTAPHTIYELDLAGNLLNSWSQITTPSVWGHRDPASGGTILFAGDETGIYAFNPGTGLYETGPSILTASGLQGYVFPLPIPTGTTTPITTARALAYNPAGNGGMGSLWVGDFGADLVEIDLLGNILTTHAANGQWSLYGLAWDPIRGRLWGSTSPNQGDLVEIDPVSGQETGVRIRRFAGGAQGGLSFMQRPGAGGGAVPFSELLCLVQGANLPTGATDAVAGHRLDLYDPAPANRGYWDEAVLLSSINGGTSDATTKYFIDGDTLGWSFGVGPQSPGPGALPVILLLSIGADATTNATTLGVPEFVMTNALSVPASVGLTATVGDGTGIGSLLAPVIPFGPDFVNGPPALFGPFPAGVLSLGDSLRLQAVVIDTAIYPGGPLPLYATNTIAFSYLAPGCIVEGFETVPVVTGSYPTGWSNGPGGTGTDQWQPIATATPSAGTGASAAYRGTTYMYCETSGAQNSWPKTFVMDTAPLPTCGLASPQLTFAYHLWGTTVGTLTVQDLDLMGNPLSVVFTIAGNQGNQWNTAVAPVTPDANGNVRLRFTYVTPAANNSWVGDACIDEVAIR